MTPVHDSDIAVLQTEMQNVSKSLDTLTKRFDKLDATVNGRLKSLEITQAFHRGGLAALAVFTPLSLTALGIILKLSG